MIKGWVVIARPKFLHWLDSQDKLIQKRVAVSLQMLEDMGPSLGRPYADTVYGSRFKNVNHPCLKAEACENKP